MILLVSVWNGASYYVEVFGRRFEKELLELRREMELMSQTESVVSAAGKDTEAEVENERSEVSEGEAAAAASGLPAASGDRQDKKDQ